MAVVPVVDALIVGSGFSGLGMAHALQKAGLNNYVILEKAAEVGGTWRENTYPGCACDVQSHLYSFSFAGNPNWSHVFSPWHEIQAYILATAQTLNLRQKVHFNREVQAAHFDEHSGLWNIRCKDGQQYQARHFIMGTGPLHVPAIPKIKGLENFRGKVMHSAQWDHSCELAGKRIASIGTGGSAIQYVPEIAPAAARLDVYQRTPAWVLPRNERAYTRVEKFLFKAVPPLRQLYRGFIYVKNEMRILPMRNPAIARLAELLARIHIRVRVRDAEIRKKLTPDYTIGCKRILISNRYLPTFNRSNVQLITEGISEIGENYIQSRDGVRRETDVIILGTGFVTDPREYMQGFPITGLNGRALLDAWANGAEAYKGINVAGFPNFHQLVGPNTGTGHSSVIYFIESQAKYIVDAITQQQKSGALYLDVKREVQNAFNEKIQQDLRNTVWSSGCNSWYQQADGRNFTIWPGTTFAYRRMTRKLDMAAYHVVQHSPALKKQHSA
ncbi:MAG: NAD(P)/FAD-dependent oxidoreductase [Oceanospirillaceae bacterium]|nr:NAD(P)/FAD-dependent oxidoreductase [Oceanospirillaceae bacterium]MCP5351168.1 NAD(P)/FAD-dependent oxidoreductase [Oceanospirillaceae bacterium]